MELVQGETEMIETQVEMIKDIMLKHEEESRLAEREECALLVEKLGAEGFGTLYIAACIRLKGEKNGDAK